MNPTSYSRRFVPFVVPLPVRSIQFLPASSKVSCFTSSSRKHLPPFLHSSTVIQQGEKSVSRPPQIARRRPHSSLSGAGSLCMAFCLPTYFSGSSNLIHRKLKPHTSINPVEYIDHGPLPPEPPSPSYYFFPSWKWRRPRTYLQSPAHVSKKWLCRFCL